MEDGETQAAGGCEDAVVEALGLAEDAVEAVEGKCGQALVFDRAEFALRDDELRLEAEDVLAVGLGGELGLVEIHVGPLGEGGGVGQFQLLPGR